ncbi:hypothetical protein [Hanstruepera flava]|uniref:hypothetical protein n=1 Tax=Hanstruepera flava TaxID=2930218 RepID=UPI00202795F4|nr:hypothetical protein [Hanstruepera flava]
MKNILNYKYILGLAVLLGFTSCLDDDQDYPAADKPVATLDMTSASIAEGETATFTINLSKAQAAASDFKLDLLSGSADDFSTDAAHLDEFEIGPEGWQVTVPGTATSVEFNITALLDLYPEAPETLKFRMTKGQQGNSTVAGGQIDFTVNITNSSTLNCGLELAWDGDADDHLCDMDFDVFLDSFGAYAFTGDCPEYLIEPVNPSNLWTSELADGTHVIVVDLWDNHGVTPGLPVPLRLTIGKVGVVMADMDLGDLYMTDSQDTANGTGGDMAVGWIEVVNGLYSIYDINGNLVAEEGI